MAGGTLASRLGPPMPLGETIAVIRAVGDALGAMHEAGYLHRDVKPSNIGMNASGDAKLLDFGLAHLLAEARPALRRVDLPAPGNHHQLEPHGHPPRLGTPLYLSPEVLGGAAPEPAQTSRRWPSSCRCVTGSSIRSDSREAAASKGPRLQRVRVRRPECPAELADLLGRALAPAWAAGLAPRLTSTSTVSVRTAGCDPLSAALFGTGALDVTPCMGARPRGGRP